MSDKKQMPMRLVIDGLGRPPRLMVGDHEVSGVTRVQFDDLVPHSVGIMRVDVMIESMEISGRGRPVPPERPNDD